MNLRRLSFLATAALCALPFLFPAESAAAPTSVSNSQIAENNRSAAAPTNFHDARNNGNPESAKKKEKTVGTVKIEGGGTITINGKTAGTGAELKCGDMIETKVSVIATLTGGPEYVIDAGSKVRLVCSANTPPRFLLIYGAIHPVRTGDDTIDPLPFLAAFGFGNNSFPSIGGGNSSNGTVVSAVLPGGSVAFFDSAGNFIRFN